MNTILETKYDSLKAYLVELEEVVIAYSGGVDSTLLLKIAVDVLEDEVIAVLAKSESMSREVFMDAIFIARKIGVEPTVIRTNEMSLEDYCSNPIDRCYHCKKHIFGSFSEFMKKNMLVNLCDGSNADDSKDYRPGVKALEHYSVLSPLKELGFTKDEIRELSKELGLSTWNKEANSCLATRIAYDEPITLEKLRKIEAAENYLRSLNFTQVRARMENGSIRIEVKPSEVIRFEEIDFKQQVFEQIQALGISSVSVDKEGYCMGSMNKAGVL